MRPHLSVHVPTLQQPSHPAAMLYCPAQGMDSEQLPLSDSAVSSQYQGHAQSPQ